MKQVVITHSLLDKLKSPRGGYTRAALEIMGISWPPKRGWRKELINEARKNEAIAQANAPQTMANKFKTVQIDIMNLDRPARKELFWSLKSEYCFDCGCIGKLCECPMSDGMS